MKRFAFLICALVCAACSGGSGKAGSADDWAVDAADAGTHTETQEPASGAGSSGGDVTVTTPPDDAGSTGSDTIAADAGSSLTDQVGKLLTCKADELNPIVDCLTAQCPMQADPIAFGTCLVGDCGKLVSNVSPKCRDCVVAGVAQDTQGLVQNCLDTSSVVGDAGLGLPLP